MIITKAALVMPPGRLVARLSGAASKRAKPTSGRVSAARDNGDPRRFARERENVGQEGFDALVHRVSPPYRPSA